MSHKLKYAILLSLIIFISPIPCLSDEMAIFCHGELYYHYDAQMDEPFLREFVVPEGGTYHFFKYTLIDNRLSVLSPEEERTIDLLSKKCKASICIQFSKPEDQKATRNVQAWCAVRHPDFALPSRIDPFDSSIDGESADILDLLDKLAYLRHLELYSFIIDSEKFSEITKLKDLEYLGLPRNANYEHLKHISGLKKLKFLNASGTEIRGKGLSTLAVLPNLKTLDLRYTQLNSGALTGLKKSRSLQTLLLSYSNVKDSELKGLIGLDSLRFLTLHCTSLTDEGLKILASLKNLKYVSVYITKTTKVGRESLLKSFPGLTLDVNRPLTPLGFHLERQLCQAYLGDTRAQKIWADNYYSGFGMLWPKDLIESLKWYYLLREQCPEWRFEEISERIKSIEKELDRKEISEAGTRARVLSFVRKRSKFDYKIERKEGLPLYQFEFEMTD